MTVEVELRIDMLIVVIIMLVAVIGVRVRNNVGISNNQRELGSTDDGG